MQPRGNNSSNGSSNNDHNGRNSNNLAHSGMQPRGNNNSEALRTSSNQILTISDPHP